MEKHEFKNTEEAQAWMNRALHFANLHSYFSYHQNNDIEYPYDGFLHVLAIGAKRSLKEKASTAYEALRSFHQESWLFGYLGYDLKNSNNLLVSENKDHVGFEDMEFFEPEHLIFIEKTELSIQSEDRLLFEKIQQFQIDSAASSFEAPTASMSKAEYLNIVSLLQDHIETGDCYEINFCQEFHGKVNEFNAVDTYFKLNELSPKPFSCFQKFEDKYILSASPERFMKKTDRKLISQPIKGTRPRGNNEQHDEGLKHELRHDEKELAENMMIVDLVRNDLARSSKSGTVKVEEIFGVYSFRQVHQMISTISSQMKDEVDFVTAIENAFPMGSMTGAPKLMVMKLIEKYEKNKRGAFSGASGYISPNGNFDFNVLIRSLFINKTNQHYSFQVGSAITYDALGENEYEECKVKASALLKILTD